MVILFHVISNARIIFQSLPTVLGGNFWNHDNDLSHEVLRRFLPVWLPLTPHTWVSHLPLSLLDYFSSECLFVPKSLVSFSSHPATHPMPFAHFVFLPLSFVVTVRIHIYQDSYEIYSHQGRVVRNGIFAELYIYFIQMLYRYGHGKQHFQNGLSFNILHMKSDCFCWI